MLFLFCSSLVCFVRVCFCLCLFFVCFVCLCLFLSVSFENHCFPAIKVFWVECSINFCFSFQFLVLASDLLFVCFLFQDVLFFLLFCLLTCFVLNHNIRFVFCIAFFSCCCSLHFWLRCFVIFDFWLLIKNISRKIGNSQNPKTKNAENGILT